MRSVVAVHTKREFVFSRAGFGRVYPAPVSAQTVVDNHRRQVATFLDKISKGYPELAPPARPVEHLLTFGSVVHFKCSPSGPLFFSCGAFLGFRVTYHGRVHSTRSVISRHGIATLIVVHVVFIALRG